LRRIWALPLSIVVALAAASPVAAQDPAPAPLSRSEFTRWLVGVKEDAARQGISRATLAAAFDGLEPLDSVLQRDRKQAEFTLTLDTYLRRIVTPETVQKGQQLAVENRALLEEMTRRYGVPGRYILAIWGMESRYGAITGQTPVIQAVATLAFEGRRATFFRGELMQALRIVDRNYIELPKLKGSWAGAMGNPQFMPSSYMAYAVDFDGDGHRDIWSNRADTFASIANYLAKAGWNGPAGGWGRPVLLSSELRGRLPEFASNASTGCRASRTLSAEKTFDQWRQIGVRDGSGTPLPASSAPAALVLPDGDAGPVFFAYQNYRAILRYNCSHLYAITVGTLAEMIGGP